MEHKPQQVTFPLLLLVAANARRLYPQQLILFHLYFWDQIGMKMKRLILIILLLNAPSLFAQGVATVLSTSKKVVASNDGKERPLSRGSSLGAGDSIITAADASANIKYLNGTLVNIAANSNYKILAYAPKHSDVQIKAELKTGSIHSKTTGKMKETLKTPVITLAILGTEYEAGFSPKNADLSVTVKEGKVQMGLNGIIVYPGGSAVVNAHGIVSQSGSTPAASAAGAHQVGFVSTTTVAAATANNVAVAAAAPLQHQLLM